MNNADQPVNGTLEKAGDVIIKEGGLTKREHFAGLAMQAFLSRDQPPKWCSTVEKMAGVAVQAADALLAELDKDHS